MWWMIGAILVIAGVFLVLFLSRVSEVNVDEQSKKEEPKPVIKQWNEDNDIDVSKMTNRRIDDEV